MNSEQIGAQVDKYLASGRKIKKLPEDSTKFFFPVENPLPAEKLLEKFALNLFEEDERFFDMLD